MINGKNYRKPLPAIGATMAMVYADGPRKAKFI